MPSTEQKIKNLIGMQSMMRSMAGVGEQARAPLTDMVSLAQITPNVGQWYFSAKCEECRSISPMFDHPFGGEQREFFTGDGGFLFKCHHCENEIEARVPDIFPFQWAG